jgi:nucleotide-binding universal stress UspA family protein
MPTHILIPTDGSDLSAATIEYGIALAKTVGAKVTGLTVSNPWRRFDGGTPEMVERELLPGPDAATRLSQISDAAARAGISCNVVHVTHGHPYKAIIDTAAAQGCDLIVMASHGRRGISAIVLGSETVKVLTHSSIPVLVFRGPHSNLVPEYFAAS